MFYSIQIFFRQEEQADQIEETAKEALNTSTEALRIAEEALQKPMEIAREINDLKTEYVYVEKGRLLLN